MTMVGLSVSMEKTYGRPYSSDQRHHANSPYTPISMPRTAVPRASLCERVNASLRATHSLWPTLVAEPWHECVSVMELAVGLISVVSASIFCGRTALLTYR